MHSAPTGQFTRWDQRNDEGQLAVVIQRTHGFRFYTSLTQCIENQHGVAVAMHHLHLYCVCLEKSRHADPSFHSILIFLWLHLFLCLFLLSICFRWKFINVRPIQFYHKVFVDSILFSIYNINWNYWPITRRTTTNRTWETETFTTKSSRAKIKNKTKARTRWTFFVILIPPWKWRNSAWKAQKPFGQQCGRRRRRCENRGQEQQQKQKNR